MFLLTITVKFISDFDSLNLDKFDTESFYMFVLFSYTRYRDINYYNYYFWTGNNNMPQICVIHAKWKRKTKKKKIKQNNILSKDHVMRIVNCIKFRPQN